MTKAIVSLSGGLDSATVLAHALNQGRLCHCVSFNYRSKHNKYENKAAKKIANHYNCTFELVEFPQMAKFRSFLMEGQDPVPEGHYEEESMRQTVVPGRNIIFISYLAGLAWSMEIEEVWLGMHAGDHFIYPDCRAEFFICMHDAIWLGTDHKVTITAPFLGDKKSYILEYGLKHGVPYHLSRTCYKDQSTACGKCGACQERLSAFKELGTEDPIEYETREILPKKG